MAPCASTTVHAAIEIASTTDFVQLELTGPARVSGTMPLSIQELPVGQYRLRATGWGVADARGYVRTRPDLSLEARPWANATAFLRGPGVTHLIGKDTWRGSLMLSAGLGTGVGALIKENARSRAQDDVNEAGAAFSQAVSSEAIERTRNALASAQQKEQDQKTLRNIWTGYFAAVWLGSAFEASLMTANPMLEDRGGGNYVLSFPSVNSWSTFWRSSLVPGAGQRYAGRVARANVHVFNVFALSAASILSYDWLLEARREQADAQRAYDSAETVEEVEAARAQLESAARDADDRSSLRWWMVGATVGAYAWNLADAFWMGRDHALRAPAGEPSDVSWSVLPELDGVRLAVTWRMP